MNTQSPDKHDFDWYLQRAELGFCWYQHLVGSCYLETAKCIDDLQQAYKWLFISLTLGHLPAEEDLEKTKSRLKIDQIQKAHSLALDWISDKLKYDPHLDDRGWSPELVVFRYSGNT
jgi:TPR repeat protein